MSKLHVRIPCENVSLIGYRCTGKTTIGKLLSVALGWMNVDLDQAIESRAGLSIPEIFSRHGEDYFREVESTALFEACENSRQVISTGGGAILSQANRSVLRRRTKVIWLRADVDTIVRRMSHDETNGVFRPQLSCGGREEIESLLRSRSPLYHSTSHLEICTDRQSPSEVCTSILGCLSGERAESLTPQSWTGS